MRQPRGGGWIRRLTDSAVGVRGDDVEVIIPVTVVFVAGRTPPLGSAVDPR